MSAGIRRFKSCRISSDVLAYALGLCLALSVPVSATAAEKEKKAGTEESASKESVSKKSAAGKKKDAYRTQRGEASYYGKEFFGRKMADGTRMDPESNIAASKSLPLGTVAEVTNLENGKSEIVEIRDRGPYVEGRIIDLTPETAENLGFKEDGVAPVTVEPLDIPGAGNRSR